MEPMDTREIVDLYYQGWIAKSGNLSEVPLADAFDFQSPVAHIEGADAYRDVARTAGAAITVFDVRHLFVEGPMACAILDWQMPPLLALSSQRRSSKCGTVGWSGAS
jgi:hypothetical protein